VSLPARVKIERRRGRKRQPELGGNGNMMNMTLTKWDILKHLQTEQERAGYLAACMAEGDPVLLAAAKQDIARAREIDAAGDAQEIWHALASLSHKLSAKQAAFNESIKDSLGDGLDAANEMGKR
jgi:DNA-binding phage protein